MKLFLDTADIEEIRTVARWGVLDGVTTNPTLYARVGGSYESILEEICSITSGPVSAEVIAEDVEKAAIRPAAAAAGQPEFEVVELTSTRKTIARRLTEAWWEGAVNLPKLSEELYGSARWLRVFACRRLPVRREDMVRLAMLSGAEVRERMVRGRLLS